MNPNVGNQDHRTCTYVYVYLYVCMYLCKYTYKQIRMHMPAHIHRNCEVKGPMSFLTLTWPYKPRYGRYLT